MDSNHISDSSDNDLVEQTLEGDEESFELLVTRYSKQIFNFIFYLCNNREQTNDLTQETFLKIWKNLKSFDQNKNFKTWIFTIARYTVIDWMRKKKSFTFSQMTGESEKSFEETLKDVEPLPDEIFERKELAEQLQMVLQKISFDYRTVILLHLYEGLTFEEIAGVVGKPMNTVKSQYRRGLEQLRKLLI